jgi:hypothetical protein
MYISQSIVRIRIRIRIRIRRWIRMCRGNRENRLRLVLIMGRRRY